MHVVSELPKNDYYNVSFEVCSLIKIYYFVSGLVVFAKSIIRPIYAWLVF